MVDMADDTGEVPVTKKKKKIKLTIFFILLTLAGGCAATWFLLLDQKLPFGGEVPPKTEQKNEKKGEAAPVLPENMVVLPPLTVNLADPQGRRLIKLSLTLETVSASVTQEITMQQPRIRDSLIMLLTSKSYADLATSESKLMLKNEITDRLNQALGGPKIIQTFITGMIIQ